MNMLQTNNKNSTEFSLVKIYHSPFSSFSLRNLSEKEKDVYLFKKYFCNVSTIRPNDMKDE